MPFKAKKSIFKKPEEIVGTASLSKEERMKYDESIRTCRDNLVTEAYALEKGHSEGFGKGIEEERFMIANSQKAPGLQPSDIAKATAFRKRNLKHLIFQHSVAL